VNSKRWRPGSENFDQQQRSVVQFGAPYINTTLTAWDTTAIMSFLIPLIKPLAYVSLPLLIVQQVANQPTPSPLRYYARLVVYVGTLFTVASCSFVAAVGMSILGRPNDTNYLVARVFYSIMHTALDIKVEIEGEEFIETWPAVYMANHQSMLDVIVIGR